MAIKDRLRDLLPSKTEYALYLLLILAMDTIAVPSVACASIVGLLALESSKFAPANLPGEAILGFLCPPQTILLAGTTVIAFWGSKELSKMTILHSKD